MNTSTYIIVVYAGFFIFTFIFTFTIYYFVGMRCSGQIFNMYHTVRVIVKLSLPCTVLVGTNE